MTIEQSYNLFGYRFRFRTNQPRAAQLFADLYSGRADWAGGASGNVYELWRRTGADREVQLTIRVPGIHVQVKPSFGDCLAGVEAAIAADLSRSRNGLHVIHGAVVYGPGGDILLSGRSGAGKTTLSLALAARGLRVGGDDIAVLDPSSNLLEPVPRCFHLDEQSVALLDRMGLALPEEAVREQFVTPQLLGVARPRPACIRFAFLLESERAATPTLVPQTQAELASALLKQTGRGHFTDIEGVRAIARLTGRCRGYRAWSADLGATADAVLRIARGGAL
jgi:hypothetical protein